MCTEMVFLPIDLTGDHRPRRPAAFCTQRRLTSSPIFALFEPRPDVISRFAIEVPEGKEMRWHQVLTDYRQMAGERRQP